MAVDTATDEVIRVEELHVDFRVRHGKLGQKRTLRAVDGVDLSLSRGRTLGLVGESGCGKTTLVRSILGLQKPTSGRVMLGGQDIAKLRGSELRRLRPKMQVVFQDPYSSLNPRMTVEEIIGEPLRINNCYRSERVDELLDYVGMTPEIRQRRPAQFSGGQRQRIGIARALALRPDVLILDEPVSSLDVSIQAQVINLLTRLQAELGLTCLLIAHDLSVVRHMSHEVAVMYLGRIVERGTKAEVFETPRHPYTHSLMAAVPIPRPEGREERRRRQVAAELPDPTNPPSGCAFRARCPRAQDKCAAQAPPLVVEGAADHPSACWFDGPPEHSSRIDLIRTKAHQSLPISPPGDAADRRHN